MEGYERKEGMDNDREEIYSKAVRAGKRTYFFDVKATRNNDYYLTITESKKSSKSSLYRPPKRRIRRRFRSDLKNITFYKNRLS